VAFPHRRARRLVLQSRSTSRSPSRSSSSPMSILALRAGTTGSVASLRWGSSPTCRSLGSSPIASHLAAAWYPRPLHPV